MNYEQIKKGYRTLRLKYFSDPNYNTLIGTGWSIEDISDLYEFNFLAVLLYGAWLDGFKGTTDDMCADIHTFKKHPQINWLAYVNYIDEVRATLPIRNEYEVEIYKAVDSIRSKLGLISNNQQLWI